MSDPNKAIDYAQANANRIYLEEYRKSLKAILMQKSLDGTLGGQERDAYAHADYSALLQGLKESVEIEETYRWNLIAAQARVEVWRTEQATARAENRATM